MDKCKVGNLYSMIVETALYLLLNHINLYSVIVDTTPGEDREIERLKDKIPENLTSNFFTKIQQNIQVVYIMRCHEQHHNMISYPFLCRASQNTFADAVVRRLKRVVTFG